MSTLQNTDVEKEAMTNEKETALSVVSKAASSESAGVSVDGLAASWTMEPDKLVLSDISFSVNKVSHVAAVIVCTYHVTS